MATPDTLLELLTAPGPSGYETAPAAAWRETARGFAEVTGDTLGSSLARVPGTGGGPLLAVVGHIDEIGLIVTHVSDEAFSTSSGWADGMPRSSSASASSSRRAAAGSSE